MILNYTTKFPDGRPTNFRQMVLDGRKKHTIRKGNRWRAGMSAQHYTGIRTARAELIREGKAYEVEPVSIIFRPSNYSGHVEPKITVVVTIGEPGTEKVLSKKDVERLAENDGLSIMDFYSWFLASAEPVKGAPGVRVFVGQLIHIIENFERYGA